MRRKDKEIKDKGQIEQIVQDAQVCRLALTDGHQPYVVPLNFGYRDDTVYFHSAAQGRKIEMLKGNPRVCLEFTTDLELVRADKSCDWGQRFKCVLAFGVARLLEDPAEKRKALDIIMAHYGGQGGDYEDSKLKITAVIAVKLTEMTGKGTG
jgi:nitroimidazol reductase NimA-like FMN-containing flavoprotein (pyridoxamine 5'-phosphate oxidase superfamily)